MSYSGGSLSQRIVYVFSGSLYATTFCGRASEAIGLAGANILRFLCHGLSRGNFFFERVRDATGSLGCSAGSVPCNVERVESEDLDASCCIALSAILGVAG